MKKSFIIIISIILLCSAILISCASGNSSEITPANENGWVCDHLKIGGIQLRTAPSYNANRQYMYACVSCCLEASMTSKKVVDGTTFYFVNVNGVTGWVDDDCYYPDWSGKPSWSKD